MIIFVTLVRVGRISDFRPSSRPTKHSPTLIVEKKGCMGEGREVKFKTTRKNKINDHMHSVGA